MENYFNPDKKPARPRYKGMPLYLTILGLVIAGLACGTNTNTAPSQEQIPQSVKTWVYGLFCADTNGDQACQQEEPPIGNAKAGISITLPDGTMMTKDFWSYDDGTTDASFYIAPPDLAAGVSIAITMPESVQPGVADVQNVTVNGVSSVCKIGPPKKSAPDPDTEDAKPILRIFHFAVPLADCLPAGQIFPTPIPPNGPQGY